MIIIGLTGGIGSGKTTVARIFEALGIPVYFADAEARKFYTLPEVIDKVIAIFGNDVFTDDGSLRSDLLARRAFADSQKLKQLNDVIHPLVMADFNTWTQRFEDKEYVILESAILFETGLNRHFAKTIVVDAPLPLCIQRVMRRDGVKSDAVQARISKQMNPSEKVRLADYVITNDEETPVIPQVQKTHNSIVNLNSNEFNN
ncbi:MAG: dephospho-CoA kinase [Bacteroidota bacterium]